MTGRYKIQVLHPKDVTYSRDKRPHVTGWSRVTSICRSLAKQKACYSTRFEVYDKEAFVVIHFKTIEASAESQRGKVNKPSFPKISGSPLTLEQCKRHLQAARESLDGWRRQMKGRELTPYHHWRYESPGGRELQARKRALGAWLAQRISKCKTGLTVYSVTNADYQILDEIVGHPVKRLSKFSTYENTRYNNGGSTMPIVNYVVCILCNTTIQTADWKRERSVEPFPFKDYEAAWLDVEYWIEMVRLAEGE